MGRSRPLNLLRICMRERPIRRLRLLHPGGGSSTTLHNLRSTTRPERPMEPAGPFAPYPRSLDRAGFSPDGSSATIAIESAISTGGLSISGGF